MAAAPSGDTGDEILIAGRVHARVLGLKLLMLDAHVTVGPPDPTRRMPAPRRRGSERRRRLRRRSASRSGFTPAAGSGRGATSTGPTMDGGGQDGRQRRPDGDGLARSARLVRQATAVLDEVSDR